MSLKVRLYRRHDEADFKTVLREYLANRGAYDIPVSQEGMGGNVGDPDEAVCYKGRFVALECKAPGGRLTQEQRDARDAILKAGGIWMAPTSLKEVGELLDMIDRGEM